MTRASSRTKTTKTPRERRALETAEVALEASGLRYLSGQIPGLAHILVVFAEQEIARRDRERARAQPDDAVGDSDARSSG